MVKKPLKKEQPRKSRQELIVRTEQFIEFMDIVREDIELGKLDDDDDEFGREFHPEVPDPDTALRLAEMFERSGLDTNLPGNWQFMLVAMANFFFDKTPTRVVTDWTHEDKNLFLRHVLEIKEKNPKVGREKLCVLLKKNMPKEYTASAQSLRVQLQRILKEKRDLIEDDLASEEDIALLEEFDRK